MRLGWLAILTIALFVATIAIGSVGLLYYYYYRQLLLSIGRTTLSPGTLDRVSSLSYNIYVSPAGRTYTVTMINDPANSTANIYLYDPQGQLLEVVQVHYNSTSITLVRLTRLIYTSTTSRSSLNFTTVYAGSNLSLVTPALYISANVTSNPLTGGYVLAPFPGLVPLYGTSFFTSYYNISWTSLASGGEPSTMATIQYAFTPVKFDGTEYRGVSLLVAPQSSYLGVSGAYTMAADIINYHGVPVAVQITISTGGANYITASLASISLS